VRDALGTGAAAGQNPRTITRQIRQALGGNLVRALTIACTEVMRAYRESSRRSYQANSDVVKGWIWHSALGTRTCPACWAMHGTFHRLDEQLDDHPNGRCAMVPVTKTWQELGFKGIPEARRQIETGADLFEKLPDADKEKVLGKAGFQAYKAGKLKLGDFVGRKRSREWGSMRYTRSLRDILGTDEARKWRSQAINREAISQRMKEQWADVEVRRIERERQIAAMSDRQLATEIRRHQQAQWRSTDLLEHVKKHQRQYAAYIGHAVGPSEIEEISKLVLTSWDRLFSNIDVSGVVSYTFLAHWQASDVLLLEFTHKGREARVG